MTTVKICFVMDCTASMGPWIHQAKTKIVEIVREVKREHKNANIKTAFVGYRDYGDDNQMIVHGFQHSAEIMHLIRFVQAEGGDDEAEDVANAMERALHLDWHDAELRMVIHIADAPAHGSELHSASISDRFPLGDPTGLDPRDFVERMCFLDIHFTFVKINSTTDRMIEWFARCYGMSGNFNVLDLSPQNTNVGADEFSPALSRLVSDSITQHTSSQAM